MAPAGLALTDPDLCRQIVRDWLADRFPRAIEETDDMPDGLERLCDISADWHIDPATANYWARCGTIDAEKHSSTIRRSVGRHTRLIWFANRAAVEEVLREKGYRRKNAPGTV
jgi:hypothetical protein